VAPNLTGGGLANLPACQSSAGTSGFVQVFGRRDADTIHALLQPASKKRQGTKSRVPPRAIAQRFNGVLGMLSSLEVKVLYPT